MNAENIIKIFQKVGYYKCWEMKIFQKVTPSLNDFLCQSILLFEIPLWSHSSQEYFTLL